MKTPCKWIPSLVAGMALLAPHWAHAFSETNFSGDYQINLTDIRDDYFYDPNGGYVGLPYGADPNYAGFAETYVPAAAGAMGAYATVTSPTTSGDEYESTAYAWIDMERRVNALPGSGLNPGDPVTLELDIRMSGMIDWSSIDGIIPQGDITADIYTWMNVEAIVYSSPDDPSSFTYNSFFADLFKSADASVATDGSTTVQYAWGWGDWYYYENGTTVASGSLNMDDILFSDIFNETFSFQIDAQIGDYIYIWADLGAVADTEAVTDGSGWLRVENDFGFMEFAVHSLTPGVVVPVPAAVWLFGSGLVGLIAVARRTNA